MTTEQTIDYAELRRAGEALREAEEQHAAAQAAFAQARDVLTAARATRRDELVKVLGTDPTPEKMRACALALDVTPARIYQLVREYPPSKR